MVPRALEQYVTQLAEKGPGSLAANMPKVSSPKVLREASEERLVSNRAGSNRYGHFLASCTIGWFENAPST